MTLITQLAQALRKTEIDVRYFLSDAPKKYKVYTIPKRKYGHRVIAQPSKALKEYQRAYLQLCGDDYSVHRCAMAYKKGQGIRENAQYHAGQSYLLKMDLENFFNSITPSLLWDEWRKNRYVIPDEVERKYLESLLFWCPSKKNGGKLILSVGAPTSPLISNFCLYSFDQGLDEYFCNAGNRIHYSRYADDLTFSSNERGSLLGVPEIVHVKLKQCFGKKLTVNHAKTFFSSKAHNRHVTGITITNEGQLSLGRKRKRYIKHLVHHWKLGLLTAEDVQHLHGWLNFARHIEPSFLDSLKRKYSCLLL